MDNKKHITLSYTSLSMAIAHDYIDVVSLWPMSRRSGNLDVDNLWLVIESQPFLTCLPRARLCMSRESKL